MMTSKPEDRLRKKGVKTRKYYKWLRWSMKFIFVYQIDYNINDDKNHVVPIILHVFLVQ